MLSSSLKRIASRIASDYRVTVEAVFGSDRVDKVYTKKVLSLLEDAGADLDCVHWTSTKLWVDVPDLEIAQSISSLIEEITEGKHGPDIWNFMSSAKATIEDLRDPEEVEINVVVL
jgi:hypothetical protein